MKKTCLFLGLICAWGAAASAAEFLCENFDSAPTGSVANAAGWTRASWLGGITGRIENVGAYVSPSNALELAWDATASSAVFTNFNSTYTPAEHPVIRCSAKLRCDNTNAFFQLGLRHPGTGQFLSFQSTNGYGVFGFLYRDGVHVPLVPNRFVDVTFFYNRSNHHYRLDYDWTNRLAWATNGEGVGIATQFTQFVVARPAGTAGTTGSLFLDDVSVETFPAHVWAWWRCTAEPHAHFAEQIGSFLPTYREGYADSARAGSSDPVWDGTADFRNAGSTRQLRAGPGQAALPLPAVTNWTLEAAVRMSPDTDFNTFFDWGTNFGFNATSAWIQIGYNSNGYVNLRLRDAQQGDVTYADLALRSYVPNGRWQHLAVVKSNAQVSLYVDYQFVTNRTLTSVADGAYAFPLPSQAAIGRTLNNANTSPSNSLIDEVRFSTKALDRSEFLQPGQPLVVDIRGNALNNDPWPLTAKCIFGKTYHLETSASCGPDADWQPVPGSAFVSGGVFDLFDVPSTVPRTNFVRLVRDN